MRETLAASIAGAIATLQDLREQAVRTVAQRRCAAEAVAAAGGAPSSGKKCELLEDRHFCLYQVFDFLVRLFGSRGDRATQRLPSMSPLPRCVCDPPRSTWGAAARMHARAHIHARARARVQIECPIALCTLRQTRDEPE